jgi:hypothetical protein
MGRVMKESFFALAEARYATGEFKHTVLDNVSQVGVQRSRSGVLQRARMGRG